MFYSKSVQLWNEKGLFVYKFPISETETEIARELITFNASSERLMLNIFVFF